MLKTELGSYVNPRYITTIKIVEFGDGYVVSATMVDTATKSIQLTEPYESYKAAENCLTMMLNLLGIETIEI